MFHWICPECGREIAPNVRECPACDRQTTTVEPVLEGSALAVLTPTSPSQSKQVVALEIGADALARAQKMRALTRNRPEKSVLPHGKPQAHENTQPDSPAALNLATKHPLQEPSDVLSSNPESIAPDGLELHLPEFLASAVSGNSLEDVISAMGMDVEEPDPPASGKVPLPFDASAPVAGGRESRTPSNATPLDQPTRGPAVIGELIDRRPAPAQPSMQEAADLRRPQGGSVAAVLVPSPTAVVPTASAPQQPRSAKPLLAPAVADLVVYSPLAGKPMRAAVPRRHLVVTDCLPRVTLPGPMLIKKLTSFRDRELEPQFPEGKAFHKPLMPRWAWGVLIAVTVLGAGFSSIFSVVPRGSSERKSVESKETAVVAPAAVTVIRGPSNPLSRAIEVTGFRIVVSAANKSQIQYVVVNHSATRFSGVTVFVTLRAANAKRGEAPLCRFAFASPDLGPYEAREMTSAIEKLVRDVSVPDWADVRAEIEIGG